MKPDSTITYSQSFEKFASNRDSKTLTEFYKQQTLPPQGYSQYDIHRRLPFYQDSLTVNQTLFLLRDNAIFLIDIQSKPKLIEMYFPQLGYTGTKVMKLHRLRESKEDANGIKINTFKVVAVQRNGTIQIFEPLDLNLQANWVRNEVTNTPMA